MKYLGLDIGGTSIKYGVFNENGQELVGTSGQVKTVRDDLDAMMNIIVGIVEQFEGLDAIGLSIPGGVNPYTGLVIEGGAVPVLGNQYVGKLIEARTGIRTVIENDANCAVLAEHWSGNGKGTKDLVCVTIGSGIGGGIIINNHLHHGKNFLAGEFGFMITKEFKDYSDFEIMSANSASVPLVKKVAAALAVPYESIDGKKVFELLEEGNEVVEEIYTEWVRCLSTGIFNIAFSLDPDKILIGGGVSAVPRIIEDVRTALTTMTPFSRGWDVDVCMHMNDAGKIGAAYNCTQSYE